MILVGTDFSATAAIAVGEARVLAGQLDVTLKLLHVRSGSVVDGWQPNYEEREWLRAMNVADGDVTVSLGTPWVELVRLAGKQKARMIVVGTHGHSGFQPMALGSTAARLALLSPLPILLVGGRERGPEITAHQDSLRGKKA